MRFLTKSLLAPLAICLAMPAAYAQDPRQKDPFAAIKMTTGPATISLKSIAEIKVPAGFKFADGDETRKLLKSVGEPVDGQEMGILIPEDESWSVQFSYVDSGHVKDDDRNKLDADDLLKSLIKGNNYANEERKKNGVSPLNIIGWETQPKYNPDTHNLEWALRCESDGQPLLNYNTRMLGRTGIMQIILVVDPGRLAATLPTYQGFLADYSFKQGQNYAEYRKGDKLAEYGLAALITGGAAVVAVKTGLFAYLLIFFKKAWKLVVVGVAAIGAFIKKLITGDRSRKTS